MGREGLPKVCLLINTVHGRRAHKRLTKAVQKRTCEHNLKLKCMNFSRVTMDVTLNQVRLQCAFVCWTVVYCQCLLPGVRSALCVAEKPVTLSMPMCCRLSGITEYLFRDCFRQAHSPQTTRTDDPKWHLLKKNYSTL